MFRTLIALIFPFSLLAADGGSLAGMVADPTGAAIPAVSVTARNTETGAIRRTQTDADGTYAFPGLPAGHYTIEAEHAGFNRYAQPALEIVAGNTQRVDIAMTLESHSDTVTVTESPRAGADRRHADGQHPQGCEDDRHSGQRTQFHQPAGFATRRGSGQFPTA